MAVPQLKANFAVDAEHGAFYTGGKVQLSDDGEHMFCQFGDKVQILQVQSGQNLYGIGQVDDADVTSFTLSPDNSMLIVATRSLLLRQWDWRQRTLSRSWKAIHTAPVSCMSFDTTSTLLATGGADSTIKVWHIIRQYCTHNLKGHEGVVSVAEFHPDVEKLQLLTAADDYKIRVWDLRTSSCLAVLASHFSVITSLQFSPDTALVYSGGRDNIVTVWDIKAFEKKKTIPVYESVEGLVLLSAASDLPALNVMPGHPHVITGGSKGVLQVWDTVTAVCVYPREGEEESGEKHSAIVQLAYNPQQDVVSVVTYDHNILLHDLADLSLRKQFAGYNDDILDIKFVGAGDSHIVVATNSELIKVFEVTTWNCQMVKGHSDIVLCVDVYRRDPSLFVSSSKDACVRLWRLNEESQKVDCVAIATGHTHAVLSVAFSRLSQQFVVSGSQDLTIKLWTLPAEWSGKGSDQGPVSLTAKLTEKAHDKDINSVTVSPNDKLIASGSQDKTAKLWRAADLSLVGVFRGHKRGIWCVQFSPVDQCLATSSADGTVRIWALSDCSCVKTFEGHESSVLKVNFLTRGMQLISSGSDGLLKLWTIKTNECVKTFDEHKDKVWALATTSDEKSLITGAGDSNIIVWKDVTVLELEESRAKQEDFILKEQELSNLLHQKKYLKAIGLTITLEQPFKLLTILKEVLAATAGHEDLEDIIGHLRDDQLDSVLRYAVIWNTNSRHCRIAQYVLSVIVKSRSPDELGKLPNIKSSLEGLLPYTERHLERLGRLLQQATFVDYTWQCMRLAGQHSGSAELGNTDELETNGRRESAPTNHQELFFVDRKTVLTHGDSDRTDSDDDDSSSDSDAMTPAVMTNDKHGDVASSSDETDSISANDDAAQSSDMSDDEVIFNVPASKRGSSKSTPLRSTGRADLVVKKTPMKPSKGTGKTPNKEKGAVSLASEPCLHQTDKENRRTLRSNPTHANTTLKHGGKSTPQKTTPQKATKTVSKDSPVAMVTPERKQRGRRTTRPETEPRKRSQTGKGVPLSKSKRRKSATR